MKRRISDIAAERGKDPVTLVTELLKEHHTLEAVSRDLGITVSGLWRFLKRNKFNRDVVVTWIHPTKKKG
jgi:hypothetical protein